MRAPRPVLRRITFGGMDRRLAGVIVVLVVLVVAVVAPNLSQRRIAGSAEPIAIPDPPARGDCVVAVADVNRLLREGNFGVDDQIELPVARYGPCDGPIVGEVVSVTDDADTPKRVPAPQYQNELSQCALNSIGYTGSVGPVVDGARGEPAIVWSPAQNFQDTAVGPSRIQRLTGQRWSACVVGAPAAQPYRGRLQDVLTAGTLPSNFGNCWRTPAMLDSEQVPCDRPHAVEILATTGLGNAPHTAADVHRSCTVYAGRMMRTEDATRAGALSYTILDLRDTGIVVPPSQEILQDTYITCLAVARHGLRLTGTLVGVGDGPLPTG